MSLDLINKQQAKDEELRAALRRSDNLYKDLANANYAYTTTKALKMIALREEGVLPASMIEKVAEGSPEVAKAKGVLILAEGAIKANGEHINIAKLEYKTLENQISREFNNVDYT